MPDSVSASHLQGAKFSFQSVHLRVEKSGWSHDGSVSLVALEYLHLLVQSRFLMNGSSRALCLQQVQSSSVYLASSHPPFVIRDANDRAIHGREISESIEVDFVRATSRVSIWCRSALLKYFSASVDKGTA